MRACCFTVPKIFEQICLQRSANLVLYAHNGGRCEWRSESSPGSPGEGPKRESGGNSSESGVPVKARRSDLAKGQEARRGLTATRRQTGACDRPAGLRWKPEQRCAKHTASERPRKTRASPDIGRRDEATRLTMAGSYRPKSETRSKHAEPLMKNPNQRDWSLKFTSLLDVALVNSDQFTARMPSKVDRGALLDVVVSRRMKRWQVVLMITVDSVLVHEGVPTQVEMDRFDEVVRNCNERTSAHNDWKIAQARSATAAMIEYQ